jgi:hypothetical protein
MGILPAVLAACCAHTCLSDLNAKWTVQKASTPKPASELGEVLECDPGSSKSLNSVKPSQAWQSSGSGARSIRPACK